MSATSELHAAWSAGTPFAAPLPESTHPIIAYVSLTAGLYFAARYGISQNRSIVYELANTLPSAVLLGFGIVFLFLAVGLYV
ncbi:hypothetical protein BGZ95_001729 [Linnemannia exigua]|uniref:Dolichyl-diphosphooligosaccharide-protein glycosyltransferase subunit OST5 n=1 Tax=Linnemannia exigua TaxID=604196 RepID=A0AAD4H4S3_9FUNG|nr:hypothetical protein BGZ95_001729 [Linnemannia exigua]